MLLVRRVVGESMMPVLQPDRVVIALSFRPAYRIGDVVIAEQGGKDIIKRITDIQIRGETTEVYLNGDNPGASTDSRQFGWVDAQTLKGKVIWPMRLHQNLMN